MIISTTTLNLEKHIESLKSSLEKSQFGHKKHRIPIIEELINKNERLLADIKLKNEANDK